MDATPGSSSYRAYANARELPRTPGADASLLIKTFDGGHRRFLLNRCRNVIGRDFKCDVRVLLPGVERFHCEILMDEQNQACAKFLGSGKGLLHNGQATDAAVLKHGDTLAVGSMLFRFCAAAAEIQIEGNDLNPRANANRSPNADSLTDRPIRNAENPQASPPSSENISEAT